MLVHILQDWPLPRLIVDGDSFSPALPIPAGVTEVIGGAGSKRKGALMSQYVRMGIEELPPGTLH